MEQLNSLTPRPARSASWKWWITGLLLLATMINYMDRMTLSNASVRVTHELNLSDEQYGNMETGFGLAFAAGSLVFGFLADGLPVYLLYPAILAAWSLTGVATGMTHGYAGLLACRTLLGFFEAGHWPCALKTTFALLSEKDRTMGNSVLQSGASIGAIVTPQIMKLIMTSQVGSWRYAFVAVGVVGLLWVGLWLLILRSRDLKIPFRPTDAAPTGDLWAIVRSRRFWAVAIVVMGMQPAWHIPRVWLIKFLETGRGYDEKTALNFNSAYYIATDIGCFFAGFMSLWLVRHRGSSPHNARRTVYIGACVFTSLTLLIPWLQKGWGLFAVLLLIGAGALALFPCWYSHVQELSGANLGRISGLLSMGVWAITSPLHTLFGLLVDHTHSYDLGLVVAGLTPWVGVIAMKLLWRRDEPALAPLASIPVNT